MVRANGHTGPSVSHLKNKLNNDKRNEINSKTLEAAKSHRAEWTEREEERIMDDDVIGQNLSSLCKELGRTYRAITNKRHEIITGLVNQLEFYEGQVAPPSILQEASPEDTRKACIILTSIYLDRVDEPDHYELMNLYSEMGLME